jgi:hypothetical protein
VPESQQQQEIVRQILGVFEALMGYTVSSWTVDTSAEKAQKLKGLFRGYSTLVEFAKVKHSSQIGVLETTYQNFQFICMFFPRLGLYIPS